MAMENLTPQPLDGNDKVIVAGTKTVTYRFTSVDTTTGDNIYLPDNFKAVAIHVEGSNVVAKFTGTSANSIEAYITSDGYWLPVFDIARPGGDTAATGHAGLLKGGTATVNVSVFGVE